MISRNTSNPRSLIYPNISVRVFPDLVLSTAIFPSTSFPRARCQYNTAFRNITSQLFAPLSLHQLNNSDQYLHQPPRLYSQSQLSLAHMKQFDSNRSGCYSLSNHAMLMPIRQGKQKQVWLCLPSSAEQGRHSLGVYTTSSIHLFLLLFLLLLLLLLWQY